MRKAAFGHSRKCPELRPFTFVYVCPTWNISHVFSYVLSCFYLFECYSPFFYFYFYFSDATEISLKLCLTGSCSHQELEVLLPMRFGN